MSFLSILTNKYVIIGILIASLLGYHYFKVTSLESDIELLTSNNKILTENNDKLTLVNDSNIIELQKIKGNYSEISELSKISSDSYIREITQLKKLIQSLSVKPKFKEKIIIKDCEIKILNPKLDSEKESEDVIFKNISNIGNVGNFN